MKIIFPPICVGAMATLGVAVPKIQFFTTSCYIGPVCQISWQSFLICVVAMATLGIAVPIIQFFTTPCRLYRSCVQSQISCQSGKKLQKLKENEILFPDMCGCHGNAWRSSSEYSIFHNAMPVISVLCAKPNFMPIG